MAEKESAPGARSCEPSGAESTALATTSAEPASLPRPHPGAVAVVAPREPQLWYCCPHCERMCPTRNTLDAHVRLHMEDKPFKCALCEAVFTTKEFLIDHVKRHSTQKTVTCSVCFQPNCSKHDIALPLRQSGERVFRSDHRNKAFAVYANLEGPKDGHLYRTPSICDHCGASFPCDSDLEKHFLGMLGNAIPGQGNNSLKEGHARPKVHRCHLCSSRFTRNYSLVVHLRTHANDRDHGCDQCDKRFVTVSRLREHVRAAHSPQPTFACKYCPSKFAWRSSLTYHVKKTHPKAGSA